MSPDHRHESTDPPRPENLLNSLQDLNKRSLFNADRQFTAVSTGFAELDAAIGGGFRAGQLILISGRAGIGKTALTLQLARNMASDGGAPCLYICYEHPTDYLLARLISMESTDFPRAPNGDGLRYTDIMRMLASPTNPQSQSQTPLQPNSPPPDFLALMQADRRGARALERIATYGERLLLMKGSSYTTRVPVITDLVRSISQPGGIAAGRTPILFIDYLQKIASTTPHTNEVARNIAEVEALKELALSQQIIVVAIAAADDEGLKAPRLHAEHLVASASLVYEADLIIIMNEKYDITDPRQLEFNKANVEQFHNYVVLSLEKNRFNAGQIDLEVRKQLQYSMFSRDMRRLNSKIG